MHQPVAAQSHSDEVVSYRPTGWYRFFKAAIVRPFVRTVWRPTLVGARNIPAGGAILASNHLSGADTLALPASVDQPMIFPAKKELFEGKSAKGRFVAWFLRAVGQVPIDRSGGRASASGLGPVETALAAGGYVGIFPEGSRSGDGRLYKGHTGAARMALDTGRPVCPVGLVNTTLKRNKLGIPVMHDAKIVIGEPLDFSAWAGQIDDVNVLRWVTNEVMTGIQQLSGQEYVDLYSSRVKRGLATPEVIEKARKASPREGLTPPPTDAQLALRKQEPAS